MYEYIQNVLWTTCSEFFYFVTLVDEAGDWQLLTDSSLVSIEPSTRTVTLESSFEDLKYAGQTLHIRLFVTTWPVLEEAALSQGNSWVWDLKVNMISLCDQAHFLPNGQDLPELFEVGVENAPH